jgi:branched-chain amino acid transport system ATP-binding protein
MSLLELNDVHTYYGNSYVLQGMRLQVPTKRIVGLFGRNGAGKTTTVRSIVGFTAPRRGSVRFRDAEIGGLPPHDIAARGISLVPQGRRIFPSLDVIEHLTLANAARSGVWTLERIFGLFPRLAERRNQRARTLSGGEQTMLAIARALLMNPTMLVMDEPTEGLAPVFVDLVADVIRQLRDEQQSILLIEQNVTLVLELVDYAYVMNKGRVAWEGAPADLSSRPDVQANLLGV